jgi:hypothetical protein
MDTVPGGAAPQGEAPREEMKQQVMGFVGKVEAHLDEYMVAKAPFHIPMGGKEFLAKVAPYLVILFAFMAVLALLALLGLSSLLAPVGMMMGGLAFGWFGIVAAVTSIGTLVLEVMAIPGLFKRTHAAWRLMFYASLVSFAGSILSFNIVGAIIGGLIGWYILFQMKELYKN